MLYEIKLNVTRPQDDGAMKQVKEHYILDADLHGQAEAAGFSLYAGVSNATDVDVFAVFRSDIKEIINEKTDDKPFFKATVIDIVTDDNGNEKELKYQVLVCAGDITEANEILGEYLRQGYDMRLDALRRVKINDYLHLTAAEPTPSED